MAGTAELRLAVPAARRVHEAARRARYDAEVLLRRITTKLETPGLDPITRAQFEQERQQRRATFDTAEERRAEAAARWEDANRAYDEAAAAEAPLWADDPAVPLLLLPLRLEVVFHDVDGGLELWVRAYPDDVHVDSHEPELSADEVDAAARYDAAVAAATDDDEAVRAAAWQALVDRLGPGRAAWVLVARRNGVPATRDGSWTRAARAGLLPHHLEFSAYAGGRLVWRHQGAPIPDPLPISFAPGGDGPGTGLPWDQASRWLVDPDAAVAAGMAVRVRLDPGAEPIERLTAVGVLTDDDPVATAGRWHDLLRAQQYTAGLAVLPAGTPTNNTDATRSAWRSRPRPRPPEEIDRLRDRFEPTSEQPAARAARAFGLDGAEVLALAPDALDDDRTVVGLAQRAVAALLGLSVVWQAPDGSSRVDVGFAVEHAARHVRSRGPLPTLRIGRQPYGVLPVTAVDLWRGDDVDARVVEHLRSFLTAFEERLDRVPRVGDGADADAVVLDVLSRQPVSARIRRTWANLGAQAHTDEPAPGVVGSIPADSEVGRLGADVGSDAGMVVSDHVPPELQAVAALRPLRDKVQLAADVRAAATVPQMEEAMSRFEVLRVALEPLERWTGEGTTYTGAFYPLAEDVSHWLLNLAIEGAEHHAVDEYVAAARRRYDEVERICDALVELEDLAVTDMAAVDQALCEALDTMAHRVDAWATSLATSRLAAHREAAPTGLRAGAYGWLTDVARRDDPDGPDGNARRSDGYIVTPSLHHATTAAVLRSGWLAHADPSALAVDVQSWRVRRALALLDGVRQGRSLGALLGYQFERALHDAGLDRHLAPLRHEYPLPLAVDPTAPGAHEARVVAGARQVVDGEALRRRPPGVALVGGDAGRIAELVAELDDVVDAVGDVLLAESVHQLVGGNPQRAGLAADAIGRGEALPPELAVIRTPSSATVVAHHVGLAVHRPAGPPGTEDGWSGDRPLAVLEPTLERWCRARLGPAGRWTFAGDGSTGSVSLGDLGWAALDVVTAAGVTAAASSDARAPLAAALLRASGATTFTPQGTARLAELELLGAHLRGVLAGGRPLAAVHLDPSLVDPWTGVDRADLHRRLESWLGPAAGIADRLRPALAVLGDVDATDAARADAQAEADAALAAAGPLGLTADGAPADLHPDSLRARSELLLDRLDAVGLGPLPAPPAPDGDGGTSDPARAATAEWFEAALEAAAGIEALVGSHLKVLPALSDGLLGEGRGPIDVADEVVADWRRDLGLVRPAVAGLEEVVTAAEVLASGGAGRWSVVQASGPDEPWVAIAAPSGRGAGASRASLVVHHDEPPADGGPAGAVLLAGLVVDSWAEAIPRSAVDPGVGHPQGSPPAELAGVAFHYDRPGARAPQALLLAVPPDPGRGWCREDVHAVVDDALQLARIRSLDLRDIPELRAVLPLPGPPST